MNRLEILYQFLAEEPNDPFNIYALATELLKTNKTKSWEFYQQLLDEHEDYVATYYHAAHFQENIGNKDVAESIYKKGMQVATKIGNRHAFNELQRAYNELLYDE
jgi:hypothetical protein